MDIDDIGNLEDSPRLVFIDKECEIIVVVNDGGELTRNIDQKKKSDVLQQSIDVHYLINAVGECISSITMWNIVNQLGKHDFSCASMVNNLKDRKLFSHQMCRNRFDLILTRRGRNCPTMQNRRCLNSAVNEMI